MFPPVSHPWKHALLVAGLALAAGSFPRAQAAAAAEAVAPIPVGINLRPVTAYDRAWVFVDAVKMATEWHYDDEQGRAKMRKLGRGLQPTPVPVDADGWPLPAPDRAVWCQFFVGMRGLFPAGEYVVTWKGTGTLEFWGHMGILSQ
jgi:hypothetical protein